MKKLLANAPGVPVPIGAPAEADQPYALTTYSQAIDIGRQLLVNDEVGALQGTARAAAVRIGNVIFASLQAKPTLGDGVALFHANHVNTGTAALDNAGLGATLARIRNQVSLTSERTNLRPDHVLIAPAVEATARARRPHAPDRAALDDDDDALLRGERRAPTRSRRSTVTSRRRSNERCR
jgi:hypothetical protein